METKESNLLCTVEGWSNSVVSESSSIQNNQVEIKKEIVTRPETVVVDSNSLMENPGQGTPARFPQHGKPGGKAAKHMMATAEDDNNDNPDNDNQVQGTIQVGRKHRVWGGKVRIYKHPARVVHKYRPGVGALKEICRYQKGIRGDL